MVKVLTAPWSLGEDLSSVPVAHIGQLMNTSNSNSGGISSGL